MVKRINNGNHLFICILNTSSEGSSIASAQKIRDLIQPLSWNREVIETHSTRRLCWLPMEHLTLLNLFT